MKIFLVALVFSSLVLSSTFQVQTTSAATPVPGPVDASLDTGKIKYKYDHEKTKAKKTVNEVVESEHGVVAADDARCSEIGAAMLREGGHAVDAAVATCLCLGVVYPMSSGIGGGAFMVVLNASTSTAQAFNSRETAPLAASQNMYAKNIQNKSMGALSVGVPGEILGLYEAWFQYGKLPWAKLFQPAITLAQEGFVVSPYLAMGINKTADGIRNDKIGLGPIFAPNGNLLKAGDICYNLNLARTLKKIAKKGPKAFYDGNLGKKFVKDVKMAGGIITMEDLRNYKVNITNAVVVNVMGFDILGMPPPSSGLLGMSLVLNILNSYGSMDFLKGPLGLHRLIEAMKHMFAIRMNLGDPKFVDTAQVEANMVSPSFAAKLRQKILDNTTFPSEYYMPKWRQLDDHGTSHFCVVDSERNVVSMTSTINGYFGAKLLSPSTGIVMNNEMDDFSAPTEKDDEKLPPTSANFIKPNKRPLSSMNPIIVLKENQLVGVLGASGGLSIIPAVIQVFLNHYIKGMTPLSAVEEARVYHRLVPNKVRYENWTIVTGEHIELSDTNKNSLTVRNHVLQPQDTGAICQLVLQNIEKPIKKKRGEFGHGYNGSVFHGLLTAVSDPRKGGRPAGV